MAINLLDSTNQNGEKYAIIELDIRDIHDIVNAMNEMVAKKEEDMLDSDDGGNQDDKKQLERYRTALKGMQFVKANVK